MNPCSTPLHYFNCRFYPSSLSCPRQGETPLHTACLCGLAGLTAELLQQGANPNLQTLKPLTEDPPALALQSPLHMAIANNHPDVVSVILEQKGPCPQGGQTMKEHNFLSFYF